MEIDSNKKSTFKNKKFISINKKAKYKNEKDNKRSYLSHYKKSNTTKILKNVTNKTDNKLKIIPLGGLKEIGTNITVFEYKNDIIVVDCGLGFPSDDMLGIDIIIPDMTYLEKRINKVRGFVITHGHEDHIGALPYAIKKINVPIYATNLTMGLIEKKLEENKTIKSVKRVRVNHGEVITLGEFKVEFIKTNHSIQDAAALAITTKVGTVVHTGDFKVDYTPVYGDHINLTRFTELGMKGVLAVLSDSTNAWKKGFTQSEKVVGKIIEDIFFENKQNRLIIATFASNIDRVQQIINAAHKFNRKVIIDGRSVNIVIEIAFKLGYLKIPKNILIDIKDIDKYDKKEICIISTGSQGESMASLSRIANNQHKKIKIDSSDTIIFSSNPIPGNEKAVSRIINELYSKGADVIFKDVHVSGHAYIEDLKLIYVLLKPKYIIPVHGEYRHLIANGKIAKSLGYDKKNIIVLKTGQGVSLDNKRLKIINDIKTGAILVDGLGIGDIGNTVMKDRQHLAENGIIIVVIAINKKEKKLICNPIINSKGFVYIKNSELLLDESMYIVKKEILNCLDKNTNKNIIKTKVTDVLSNFLWKKIKRNPVIMPVILNV